jgi:hypothetical protein
LVSPPSPPRARPQSDALQLISIPRKAHAHSIRGWFRR